MLKKVTLALDPTDPESWTRHEVEDVRDFLLSQFDRMPDTARIYHEAVSAENDVTPSDEEGIERLGELPGPFYLIVYPAGPLVPFLPYIFAVAIAVASYLLAPAPPPLPTPAAGRNSQASSPNNELSDRANRPRINGRIPDIFGTVRSTPDLIAAPYKVFENNREVEYAYMCIGRGEYDVSDIRDGDTLCSNISGISIHVYDPYTSPNQTPRVPSISIGQDINSPVFNSTRSNSVNGQILRSPNSFAFVGDENIRFASPNIIELLAFGTNAARFSNTFAPGDLVDISDASYTSTGSVTEERGINIFNTDLRYFIVNVPTDVGLPSHYAVGQDVTIDFDGTIRNPNSYDVSALVNGTYEITHIEARDFPPESQNYLILKRYFVYLEDGELTVGDGTQVVCYQVNFTFNDATASFNLNGTGYTIVSVSDNRMTLSNPSAIAADWATIPSNGTPYISPTLSIDSQRWEGPYIFEDPNLSILIFNFVSPNGLYKDDGTTQLSIAVELEVEVTPVDSTDTPIGPIEIFATTIIGSSFTKEQVGISLECALESFTGRCSFRCRRITQSDTAFTGQVVDEVRWKDAYSLAPVADEHFGNVTTVHSVTYATASVLAVKERKLNMLVTRKIPARISGSTFTETLTASDDAADILCAICQDLYIGNRTIQEIDVDNIYDTMDAVEAYFDHANARKFSYTFDNDNISFQETFEAVANAVFCTGYRTGSVIKVSFEKETDDSTLLFNHRNKIPGSEKRTISFGKSNDNDGIEYVYIDPEDDSAISIFLPESYPSTNPLKVESAGVRNHLQAYFHAWRAWNKLRYQNAVVEFEATQEADLLVRNDRILVADGTRPYTQDGEVLAIDTLELTLSQDVDLTEYANYVIFLQLRDGTTESIGISAGSADNKVVLDQAPTLTLVTDADKFARTTYVIVGDTESQQTAFLVTEKEPSGHMLSEVKAVNYDARYYQNDLDYLNAVITVDGYGGSGGFTPGTGTGFLVLPDAPVLTGTEAGTTLEFDWTEPDEGSHSIVSYRIYNSNTGAIVATISAPTLTYSNTFAAGTYDFHVVAVDSRGNESVPSNEVELTAVSGPNLFLAVSELASGGTGRHVATSPDGVTWTIVGSITTGNWRHVAYSIDLQLFCAINFNAGAELVMTSPDGVTWTDRAIGFQGSWRRIIWVGELSLFVAVAGSGATARVMTSPDGIAWTSRTPAETNSWAGVCWSPTLSLLVAVAGSGTNRVMTSPDGITWTSRSAAEANAWQSVCWSEDLSLFVAVASNGTNRVMTSPDGITWTARSCPINTSFSFQIDWIDVLYADALGLFVAVSNSSENTSSIMTSPDGITWTSRDTIYTGSKQFNSIAWSPTLSLLVITQSGGSSSTEKSLTSPDGITWTPVVSDLDENLWSAVIWA